jgi:hypothetical protein
LGGRSFSAETFSAAEGIEQVEFVIDTPRVTLAPRQEVSLDNASALLSLAGKPSHSTEVSVCSELQNDIVAIIAIDGKALEAIVEKWGSRATFSSPLIDMRHNDEKCLTIDTSDKVCYMRLFDGNLQRAEAYVATTAEDILYNVKEWLGEREIPIYIKSSAATAKLLRKYFKRVICE